MKIKLAIFSPEYIFIAILNNTLHLIVLPTFCVLDCEYCQLYCQLTDTMNWVREIPQFCICRFMFFLENLGGRHSFYQSTLAFSSLLICQYTDQWNVTFTFSFFSGTCLTVFFISVSFFLLLTLNYYCSIIQFVLKW